MFFTSFANNKKREQINVLKIEKMNENSNNQKQRHGCLTAWLILMIIANSIVAISYIFGGKIIAQNFPGGISNSILIILAIIGIANVVFSILLFKWMKIGFWGFLATSFITLGINLSIGISIWNSLLGLLGVIILYGVLQIKKGNVSAWDNLN